MKYTTNIKGDTLEFEGTPEEVAEQVASAAKLMDELTENVTGIKQAILAKGVFTGTVDAASPTAAPVSSGYTETDPGSAVPSCKHGPMDDLAGKNYKKRFYCTLKTENWRDKCPPRD